VSFQAHIKTSSSYRITSYHPTIFIQWECYSAAILWFSCYVCAHWISKKLYI